MSDIERHGAEADDERRPRAEQEPRPDVAPRPIRARGCAPALGGLLTAVTSVKNGLLLVTNGASTAIETITIEHDHADHREPVAQESPERRPHQRGVLDRDDL